MTDPKLEAKETPKQKAQGLVNRVGKRLALEIVESNLQFLDKIDFGNYLVIDEIAFYNKVKTEIKNL